MILTTPEQHDRRAAHYDRAAEIHATAARDYWADAAVIPDSLSPTRAARWMTPAGLARFTEHADKRRADLTEYAHMREASAAARRRKARAHRGEAGLLRLFATYGIGTTHTEGSAA
ncbi:hypothetical protein [Agromyces larvae]|uniref:TrwC relaxase domain-containing protein n=1 Tax=Agromyces larvae TaxID=2929802 RepID=A0ABY4C6X4_9MICO|nr:hypothetical protein [Agromyces larvae]UOE45946.1 hypothetical protein MTO99_09455 [Agromyces larvae]